VRMARSQRRKGDFGDLLLKLEDGKSPKIVLEKNGMGMAGRTRRTTREGARKGQWKTLLPTAASKKKKQATGDAFSQVDEPKSASFPFLSSRVERVLGKEVSGKPSLPSASASPTRISHRPHSQKKTTLFFLHMQKFAPDPVSNIKEGQIVRPLLLHKSLMVMKLKLREPAASLMPPKSRNEKKGQDEGKESAFLCWK